MIITFNRKFVLPQKYFQPDVKGEFFRHNFALFTDKFLCYLDNIFSLMWRGFFQMQGKWTMVSLFTDNFLWYLDNIFSLIWRGLLSEARQGHQGEALVSLPCFWQKSPLYQTTLAYVYWTVDTELLDFLSGTYSSTAVIITLWNNDRH